MLWFIGGIAFNDNETNAIYREINNIFRPSSL